jgi:hypothetical protein
MCLMMDAETPLHMRIVDGLQVRVAETPRRGDDAILRAPWPESLLAFQRV